MSAPKREPETAADWLNTAANHRGAAHWLDHRGEPAGAGFWLCGCGAHFLTARELQTHILTAGSQPRNDKRPSPVKG